MSYLDIANAGDLVADYLANYMPAREPDLHDFLLKEDLNNADPIREMKSDQPGRIFHFSFKREISGYTIIADPSETTSRSDSPDIAEESAKAKFHRLSQQWINECGPISSITEIIMMPSYQKIIGMGKLAVPLILEELKREPNYWFWALECITESDPIPPDAYGDMQLMANIWIEWGRRHNLVS